MIGQVCSRDINMCDKSVEKFGTSYWYFIIAIGLNDGISSTNYKSQLILISKETTKSVSRLQIGEMFPVVAWTKICWSGIASSKLLIVKIP